MRRAPVVKLERTAATPRRRAGFTLIELIVVVAISAILAGLAAPSMGRLIAQQRLKSAAGDLHLAMVKARAEAIKRNTNVTVSPTGGAWANGWTIPDPASTTAPALEVHGPITSVTVATSATQVVYAGTGRPTAATAGASFVFSSATASSSRCLTIDLTGHPYLKEGSTC